ncbi:hypothetical protein [Treponema sp. R6D11]
MVINAKITGIKYTPSLCDHLITYQAAEFESVLNKNTVFLLDINGHSIAISKWVSPKRTRSYPGARVYNTLGYFGKKVTIIPFVKDEGADGDRDFIQWDTISLMSLLGVYVIVAFYSKAGKNDNYKNKITNQIFDSEFIIAELDKLLSYQSDALHWNIEQINNITIPANMAKHSYCRIQNELNVKMHSITEMDNRIKIILQGKDEFMNTSRNSAKEAQIRETHTIQPKEKVTDGIKAQINITNYLGGTYYLTCDEAKIINNEIHIIEAKHTKYGEIPSLDDIKEGFIKMILFSNLKAVTVNDKELNPIPFLKLTSESTNINLADELIKKIIFEAKTNNFKLILPDGKII